MFEVCSKFVRSGRIAMDSPLDDILNSLPEKPPRSILNPYADLIDELRQRGWTYRGIVGVLAEKCGVKVSVSNVHHFARRRSRTGRKGGGQLAFGDDFPGKRGRNAASSAPSDRRPDDNSEFTFDPTVPLRIKQH
jgi:hypothetical protein